MPDKSFKVNIFDVEMIADTGAELTSFRDAIENASVETFQNRYKEVNGKGRRLENHAEQDGCFLLNFVSLEFAGPGRTRPDTATVPIGLAPEEYFSQEMSMLYDPEENLAFVESALGTMGTSSIVGYFKAFANTGTNYLLVPRLDNAAAARARRYQTIRRLKMRVAMGPVTSVDRDAGIDVLKAFGGEYDAGFLDLEIKAQRERGRTLSLEGIWRSINHILGDTNENNVTQLIVTGRENDDDRMVPIDLIQHREKRERWLHVDDTSRKVPHAERWNALIEIRRQFLA